MMSYFLVSISWQCPHKLTQEQIPCHWVNLVCAADPTCSDWQINWLFYELSCYACQDTYLNANSSHGWAKCFGEWFITSISNGKFVLHLLSAFHLSLDCNIDRQKQYSDENGCKICCEWKHYPLCIWHNFILMLNFRSLLQHLQSEAFIFSDKPELHQVSFNLQGGSAQLTA